MPRCPFPFLEYLAGLFLLMPDAETWIGRCEKPLRLCTHTNATFDFLGWRRKAEPVMPSQAHRQPSIESESSPSNGFAAWPNHRSEKAVSTSVWVRPLCIAVSSLHRRSDGPTHDWFSTRDIFSVDPGATQPWTHETMPSDHPSSFKRACFPWTFHNQTLASHTALESHIIPLLSHFRRLECPTLFLSHLQNNQIVCGPTW